MSLVDKQELRIAVAAVVVIVVLLVGGQFLFFNVHLLFGQLPDSTHHGTQTKCYGHHLGLLVGRTH